MQTLAQNPADGNAVKVMGEAGAEAQPAASTSSGGGGMDTVSGLLGSPEGAALRRVAMDADSISLVRHLVRVPADPSA